MPPSPILEIDNIFCGFGSKTVLRGISLQLAPGETVALLGRSGSGKTTLLKTVNRLIPTTAGEIRFEGKALDSWDLIQLRRRMGYVIQDAGLFPHWTVEANVGLVPRLAGWAAGRVSARVAELLASVGLDPAEFRHRYPRQLSGGQRQRVGIARALAADPPLLLLDEPFAALDPITRFDLQRQFVELRSRLQKAALFVTHDVREALMVASRIALLREGVLDLVEAPSDFLRARSPEATAFLAGLDDRWRPDESRPPV